jgi:hypothetical protein
MAKKNGKKGLVSPLYGNGATGGDFENYNAQGKVAGPSSGPSVPNPLGYTTGSGKK